MLIVLCPALSYIYNPLKVSSAVHHCTADLNKWPEDYINPIFTLYCTMATFHATHALVHGGNVCLNKDIIICRVCHYTSSFKLGIRMDIIEDTSLGCPVCREWRVVLRNGLILISLQFIYYICVKESFFIFRVFFLELRFFIFRQKWVEMSYIWCNLISFAIADSCNTWQGPPALKRWPHSDVQALKCQSW